MAKKKEEKIVEITEPIVDDTVQLEILVEFTDKYTGAIYEVGNVYSFAKDRAEELLKDSRKLVK